MSTLVDDGQAISQVQQSCTEEGQGVDCADLAKGKVVLECVDMGAEGHDPVGIKPTLWSRARPDMAGVKERCDVLLW